MNTKPPLFAIGDIHGCVEELRALLASLPLTSDSQIIFLGDYVDRGPDSKGVIDCILALKKKHRVIALKGNHEEMMLDFLHHPESTGAALFILNGGAATLASYERATDPNLGVYGIPNEHKRFLDELELFWQDDEYFFVHAGVPNLPLNEIDPVEYASDFVWIRSSFLNSNFVWEKTIVHGHSPVAQCEITPQKINVDTGCVYNNLLSAIELRSKKVYSIARKQIEDSDVSMSGNRIAHRFVGSADVWIEKDGVTLEFETLNFNESGMLLKEKEGKPASLQIGESLAGRVGSGSFSTVQKILYFTGELARTETRGEQVLYGVKILTLDEMDHSLKNLRKKIP